MKINYTKQMLSASIGETIYKIDWKKHKGMKQKQSGWKRWRVVKVVQGEDTQYKVESTCFDVGVSVIPRMFGGLGFFYGKLQWDDFSFDKSVFSSHKEALDDINSSIAWFKKMECEKSEEIIGWFPE